MLGKKTVDGLKSNWTVSFTRLWLAAWSPAEGQSLAMYLRFLYLGQYWLPMSRRSRWWGNRLQIIQNYEKWSKHLMVVLLVKETSTGWRNESDRKLIKFNRWNCKDLNLGRNNPRHHLYGEPTIKKKSFSEGDLGPGNHQVEHDQTMSLWQWRRISFQTALEKASPTDWQRGSFHSTQH